MFSTGKSGFLNPSKVLRMLQKVWLSRKDPAYTLIRLSPNVKNENINSDR